MDKRLYYEDAYCTRFTAQVAERLTHEEQAGCAVESIGLLSDVRRAAA